VAALRAELDEAAFVARAGNGINQQLVAAKLRWLARHEPDIFARIATVFGSYDYINHRLTGQRRAERNWALEAGFVDAEAGTPADDLIALGGIPREAVPPLVRSDEIHGRVTPAAAAATGLAAGTLVMGGAADHIASAYAAGVLAPGDVLLKFGGAADILTATARYAPDPRMFLDHHLAPGLWMPNGCMATGGVALNWFAERFGAAVPRQDGETLHAALDRLAAAVPPGADGVMVVPYFLGEKTPLHDPDARGTITGLSLSHGLGHVWRALLEGYGYAFRHHVEVLREMGCPARRFIASDGGARSRVWMQAVANILQAEIALLEGHPGSCLGAAWTAAIGAGLSDDWGGVARFVRQGATVRPDPATAALHDAGYRRFRETYERLRGLGGGSAS
jgi:xylulokinase